MTNEMNDELKRLYKQLAESVIKYNKGKAENKQLTICPAIRGSETANIMVVGRAINGWCGIADLNNANQVVDQIENCSNIGLDWVCDALNSYVNCNKLNCPKAQNGCSKAPQNSPFWKLVKYINNDVNKGENKDDAWQENIIWSNLFKASFKDGGNPPNNFYRKQTQLCQKILQKEIEEYKPRYIFFITEKNSEEFTTTWLCKQYRDRKGSYDAFRDIIEYLKHNYPDNSLVCTRPEFHDISEIYDNIKMIKDIDY